MKKKALKAYKKFLSQDTIKWNKTSTKVKLSKCEFLLVYLDNNSVPELIVSSGSNNLASAGGEVLYTYKNGKVKYVDYAKYGFYYYKKKGVYYKYYDGGQFYYYTFSKGKSKYVLNVINESVNSRDWEGDGKRTYAYYKITNSSTGAGKYILESEYKAYFKKLVGSKKAKEPKLHKNTAKNRKKYIK
ncbi:MAG: hypothetical protein LUF92_01380 [Clostridiales bacterium]|nr:hypothetical protein [Clostridiales bacterium]